MTILFSWKIKRPVVIEYIKIEFVIFWMNFENGFAFILFIFYFAFTLWISSFSAAICSLSLFIFETWLKATKKNAVDLLLPQSCSLFAFSCLHLLINKILFPIYQILFALLKTSYKNLSITVFNYIFYCVWLISFSI